MERMEYHQEDESRRALSGGRKERTDWGLSSKVSTSIGRLFGGNKEMVDWRDLLRSEAMDEMSSQEFGMDDKIFLRVKAQEEKRMGAMTMGSVRPSPPRQIGVVA